MAGLYPLVNGAGGRILHFACLLRGASALSDLEKDGALRYWHHRDRRNQRNLVQYNLGTKCMGLFRFVFQFVWPGLFVVHGYMDASFLSRHETVCVS